VSLAIDYLPESYRARAARTRDRRERLLMAMLLGAALFATDWILRMRVGIARQVAVHAESHAIQGEQRAEQTRQLGRRVADARARIEAWVEPLAAPRLTAVLDELLADRPTDLAIHELTCRHEPWSADAAPTIRLVASCDSPATFTAYTAALRAADSLPKLTCQRTFRTGDDNRFGFHLESTAPGATR
jgi:hypothetical protein